MTTTSQNNNLTYASSRLDNGRLNTSKNIGSINISSNTTQNTANNVIGNKTITSDAATTPDKAMLAENSKPKTAIITDKQLDILNIQVTRQIQPSSQADAV